MYDLLYKQKIMNYTMIYFGINIHSGKFDSNDEGMNTYQQYICL